MRALVCHARLDLRFDEMGDSDRLAMRQPGPTELGVRIAFGGICGSDLHYFQHGGFGTVQRWALTNHQPGAAARWPRTLRAQ